MSTQTIDVRGIRIDRNVLIRLCFLPIVVLLPTASSYRIIDRFPPSLSPCLFLSLCVCVSVVARSGSYIRPISILLRMNTSKGKLQLRDERGTCNIERTTGRCYLSAPHLSSPLQKTTKAASVTIFMPWPSFIN